ncbi:MAG TPA: trypsin-like peptidase domain-containing protein [Vampirovibrionales bacterium]
MDKLKPIIAICLSLGLGFGLGYGLSFSLSKTNQLLQTNSSANISQSRSNISLTHSSYAKAVSKASPAVVNVFSEKVVTNVSPIQMFFGDIFERRGYGIQPPKRRQQSLGSGVVISSDGYILTNNHVISGADKIQIVLNKDKDKEQELEAKVIGSDEKTDLALLKIKANNLPYLKFADSDKASVGDVVLALGNPFGIGQTVTMGIISAKKRENLGILDFEDFLQTDAAINPGNSGGALIDPSGELLGINTALYSRSGGYQGISFAVPSNLAQSIAQQLKTSGKVKRSYLGVSVINLEEYPNPYSPFFLKEGFTEGALILNILEGGPADLAGLKVGTLIQEVSGKKIKTSEQLFKIVSQTKPETALKIKAYILNPESKRIKEEIFSVKPSTE